MEGQYRGRQGREKAMFVFHQQQINGVYNCTILGAAIMAFTSFIILLRRERASLEGQRTANNIPLMEANQLLL